MSDKEKIPTLLGSESVPNPSELAYAFPDVSPGLKPLGARVIVQLLRVRKTAVNSRIVLVSETKENEKWQNMVGRIVAIGPLAFVNRDTLEPWKEGSWAQLGDYVRVPKWGGDRWERVVPGEDKEDPVLFTTINDHELISTVTDNPLSFGTFIK